MSTDRHILHVDMDAFYASVEQRDNPELRNKPLVVGGGTNRGVVAAASYEARVFGVRSAMPIREANRRCPDLLRVAPRMSHYQAVSKQIFKIFGEFTPDVEGLSLDEAFLDVTGSISLFGSEVQIAQHIKTRIIEETGLTASVGVATNKLVAKIASDLDKPDGMVVVTPDNLREILDPLPIKVIPGIGPETRRRLTRIGLSTLQELRSAPDKLLEPVFGRFTQRIKERAAGTDSRSVASSRNDKSISSEETFEQDLVRVSDMHRELLRLTERTTRRLRAKELLAGTVQLKIRQADFTTFSRQQALHPPANSTDQLYESSKALLAAWLAEHPGARIRLLGVGGSDLGHADQADMFAPQTSARGTEIDQAVDRIQEKFGNIKVGRARSLDPDQIR